MKIYTSQQMRQREQAAVDKGTTFEGLMENAGHSEGGCCGACGG